MTPIRIQRKRAKGWRMPENTVYVGRPTKWGNPYNIGDFGCDEGPPNTREDVVALYREYRPWEEEDADLSELRGKNLACWCPLPDPGEPDHCHAAALLALANA